MELDLVQHVVSEVKQSTLQLFLRDAFDHKNRASIHYLALRDFRLDPREALLHASGGLTPLEIEWHSHLLLRVG